tara:strand:+ start:236 stop:586 length:351 start_codon:yes stop_codon:yes gene_type:complete
MENKQAVAVAVGVGAVGTALAYLGYSYANSNSDIDNLADAQNNSWWANLWANSNTDGEKLYNEVDDGPQLKAALNEDGKNVKVEKKESAWPTFWKESYDEDKKTDNKEEVTAADMN